MALTKLRSLRKKHKWTQNDLAIKSGYSRSSIINWETGKRVPRIIDIERLAQVLGVTTEELLEVETSQVKEQPLPEDFSFWGRVVDMAQKTAKRSNQWEINLILPLLKSAYDLLAQIEQNEENPSVSNSIIMKKNNVGGNLIAKVENKK